MPVNFYDIPQLLDLVQVCSIVSSNAAFVATTSIAIVLVMVALNIVIIVVSYPFIP